MLEAHILSHVLAASFATAQPAANPEQLNPPPLGEVAARRAEPAPAKAGGGGDQNANDGYPRSPSVSLREPPPPKGEDLDTAIPTAVPGQRDPLEGFNRLNYKISQPIDRFIIRPVALTYKTVLPHPLRDGLRNFIGNLFEPLVFFNDVVQLRPRRALRTAGRMALNTFMGFGGVFDIAKRPPYHLPHHDNGFGDTLGFYGIGPIAYVYVPVLGPTTLRDMVGEVGDAFAEPRLLDRLVHPDSDRPLLRAEVHLGKYRAIAEVVQGLDRRAESDAELEAIRRTAVDPYATLRSSFLQDRAGEIAGLKAKNGQAPVNPALDDPLVDPDSGIRDQGSGIR